MIFKMIKVRILKLMNKFQSSTYFMKFNRTHIEPINYHKSEGKIEMPYD